MTTIQNNIISFPTGSNYTITPNAISFTSSYSHSPGYTANLTNQKPIYEYVIPANSAVYVTSESHIQKKLHDILTLANISHLYNEKTDDIIMYIDDECVFGEKELIQAKQFQVNYKNNSGSFGINQSGLQFKLPTPHFGITYITTFEYKTITTWVEST